MVLKEGLEICTNWLGVGGRDIGGYVGTMLGSAAQTLERGAELVRQRASDILRLVFGPQQPPEPTPVLGYIPDHWTAAEEAADRARIEREVDADFPCLVAGEC